MGKTNDVKLATQNLAEALNFGIEFEGRALAVLTWPASEAAKLERVGLGRKQPARRVTECLATLILHGTSNGYSHADVAELSSLAGDPDTWRRDGRWWEVEIANMLQAVW